MLKKLIQNKEISLYSFYQTIHGNLHIRHDLWHIVTLCYIAVCVCPQTLQHGAGECEGDVDRGAQDREGQEEIQACQQRSLHLQDVPTWGLCHPRAEEPTGDRQVITMNILCPWVLGVWTLCPSPGRFSWMDQVHVCRVWTDLML